jgi:hypothetical protein
LFWTIIPVVGPVLYLHNQHKMAGGFTGSSDAGSFLSLPLPVADPAGILVPWDRLEAGGEVVKEQLTPDPSAGESMPAEEAGFRPVFAVSNFGYIQEGQSRVFFLYDERIDRWFRMEAGQVDEVSRVRAGWDAETGFASLYDLDTGEYYQIKPGAKELEHVEID